MGGASLKDDCRVEAAAAESEEDWSEVLQSVYWVIQGLGFLYRGLKGLKGPLRV